jgi:hypothetical protein
MKGIVELGRLCDTMPLVKVVVSIEGGNVEMTGFVWPVLKSIRAMGELVQDVTVLEIIHK